MAMFVYWRVLTTYWDEDSSTDLGHSSHKHMNNNEHREDPPVVICISVFCFPGNGFSTMSTPGFLFNPRLSALGDIILAANGISFRGAGA
jgi:hypothetical protein